MKDILIESSIQMFVCSVIGILGVGVTTWQFWVIAVLLAIITELRDNYIKKKAVKNL